MVPESGAITGMDVYFRRLVVGFWSFGLEKAIEHSELVGCSLGAWKVRMLREKQTMACDVSEDEVLESLRSSIGTVHGISLD